MNRRVMPGRLEGTVTVPPSKSMLHRIMLASWLAGEEYAAPAGSGQDVLATEACLKAFRNGEHFLNAGASGSTLRFLLPVAAKEREEITFTGDRRLFERPHTPLIRALTEHGAAITAGIDRITVRGPVFGGEYSLPGDVSSQFVSGLMFLLPFLPADSRIRICGRLQSSPYAEMTRQVLASCGVRIGREQDGYSVPGGQECRMPRGLAPEPDLSLAAYWKAANRFGSLIEVKGLPESSLQADAAFELLADRVGGEIDVSDAPDLMPVLSVLAALKAGRKTVFHGIRRLRYKESDRVEATAEMLKSLGIRTEADEDEMTVFGGKMTGGTVDGRRDHRIVMSAAVAALRCEGPVTILRTEYADKSYPGFFDSFAALGGECPEVL